MPAEVNAEDIVKRILGHTPFALTQLMPTRRAGHMEYWKVESSSGASFLKIATGERTKKMISEEIIFYEVAKKRDFLPEYFGGCSNGRFSSILIEDLSSCSWAPPWDADKINGVVFSLERLKTSNIPEISRKVSDFKSYLLGWHKVRDNPVFIKESNICDMGWLEKKMPLLIKLSEQALHDSTDLIHFDVRSDNVCFKNNRALLLDWTWYCRGAFDLQLASWALTLSLEEGGLPPDRFLPKIEPCYISLVAGYFAQFLGIPCRDGSHVRELQFRQLVVALDWLKKIL